MKKFFLLFCVVALLIGLLILTNNMSFFSKVIASEVSGKVMKAGNSAPNLKLTREVNWVWGNETIKDEVITSSLGEFNFPEIRRTTFFGSLLPHEPLIKIQIKIYDGEKAIEAYTYNKHDYNKNGELDGFVEGDIGTQKFTLTCDTTKEPARHNGNGSSGSYYGLCEIVVK